MLPLDTHAHIQPDRKSTRLNSSHTEIYTLSLHDALPISLRIGGLLNWGQSSIQNLTCKPSGDATARHPRPYPARSEEHTSELQSHRDLHSFPTRRSSDLVANRGLAELGAVINSEPDLQAVR